jgi:hypothetical protein
MFISIMTNIVPDSMILYYLKSLLISHRSRFKNTRFTSYSKKEYSPVFLTMWGAV